MHENAAEYLPVKTDLLKTGCITLHGCLTSSWMVWGGEVKFSQEMVVMHGGETKWETGELLFADDAAFVADSKNRCSMQLQSFCVTRGKSEMWQRANL